MRIHPAEIFAFLPTLALACSVSIGGGNKTTKPAGSEAAPTASAPKPVAAEEPADEEPTPPAHDEAKTAEATPRAVCRIADAQLAEMCHRAFDPIAAADDDAWVKSLSEDVVLLRPGPDGELERLQGARELHRAMKSAGGIRALMHTDAERRIVGTLIKDCRTCTRAFVAVTANTEAGALAITVDPTVPPRVTRIELRREGVARTDPKTPPRAELKTKAPPGQAIETKTPTTRTDAEAEDEAKAAEPAEESTTK